MAPNSSAENTCTACMAATGGITLLEAGQHFGVEEFHAVHRQHRVECRRIVRHARAVAAAIVGQRQIVALGDACLDRAIGIVVQRLRRRIGAFLGDRDIGQHVPVGVGQDRRRTTPSAGHRAKSRSPRCARQSAHRGRCRPTARRRPGGRPAFACAGRPAQHRRVRHHPTWLFTKSLTIDTMPRASSPSSASTNWSTCSRWQISGGSSRMTLRLYSVKATSTP